jgi:DnaJ-class molecular chaperone
MRVIKEYKPCEQCKGTGLEWQDQYSWDCRVCQGYGEVIETRKEIEDERELPTRSV